jgi:hypothetical protein
MFVKPIKILVQMDWDANIDHYTAVGMRYLTVRSKPEMLVHHHDTKDIFPLGFDVVYDDTLENERRLMKIQENTRKIHTIMVESNTLRAESNPVKAKEFLQKLLGQG